MRPTPAELITHVRRVLRDVVEPELTSEYARARLTEVRAVLAQVDWDNAGLQVRSTATALRETLAEFRVWVDADERRQVHFGPSASLDLLDTDAADFAGWNELHARYTGIVVSLIDPLEDWLRANPDDKDGLDLRRQLLTLSAG
ncbi:hypothetical protein ACFS2C_02750 [Prauserella oleivorans]|uniref:Uncharacterized protein n=1 Tax=Prauserella oleivorans TaxID=1478153 RepID=A0ABW5W2Y9_9PSEU